MIFATTASQVAKKSKIVTIIKPKRTKLPALLMRTHYYNISLDIFF